MSRLQTRKGACRYGGYVRLVALRVAFLTTAFFATVFFAMVFLVTAFLVTAFLAAFFEVAFLGDAFWFAGLPSMAWFCGESGFVASFGGAVVSNS